MLRNNNSLKYFKKTIKRNWWGLIASQKRFNSQTSDIKGPLDGVRVLELGQIKVETPETGDPIRIWRKIDIDGVSPWFRSMGRNKKSCEINLRTEGGRKLVRQLTDKCDVLIENFRPGTMEKWGLGPDELYKTNPSLIYTRVSGFGQTGPYASNPGFASVCEAMAGFRYITGFPDMPPVRQNISLGDSVAGLTAAFGTVMGLLARNKINSRDKTGQVVDVAIYESMFNMMEGILPEYDRFGEVNSKYVIIGGNGDAIYKRLMKVVGREDLTTKEYETNKERVKHKDTIDNAISDWTRTYTSKEVVEKLEKAEVPCGHIYNIKDIVEDEHVQDRGLLETIHVANKDNEGWDLKVPAMSPKLTSTPGETKWAGPDLGQHNREILFDILGLSEDDVKKLQKDGIVGKTD
ncbi:7608_t:CDS:2 [Gigaspora margarita]|uniref:7608_t:CDS:1 n=1 Tax=Gigaspora margarita TaxID=4874 RepID=A0ABM8W5N8_GIGMA|nr:7608_t:CDS:2 [Gigaspora margarita]